MPNRTRMVASAIVCASVVATSISFAAVSFATFGTAHAADECQSAPQGHAPAGAHWYYRSDRKTNRKCWYVADIPKPEKAASQRSAASSPKPADTKLPPATANARAELLTTATPLEQPVAADPPSQPKPAETAKAAPNKTPQEALQETQQASPAALYASAQPSADPISDHSVVIADDSVNVDPGPDTQAEPLLRAAAVQRVTAPAVAATAAAEAATAPLPAAFGWILIGLGLLIFAGGLAIKLSSAVRFERSPALRA